MKERDISFDIAKAFAMICIVAGHMDITPINRFIYTFHVPLFFIVSGYFFRPVKTKIKQQSLKLIKAYTLTSTLVLAFGLLIGFFEYILFQKSFNAAAVAVDLVFSTLYGSGSRCDFFSVNITPIGATWFLLALIWVNIFTFFILKLKNRTTETLAILLLFAFGFFSAKETWLPLSLQAGCTAVPFFYVGYIAGQNKQTLNIKSKKTLLFLSVVFSVLSVAASFLNENPSLVRCYFPNLVVIDVLGAFSLTYIFLKLSQCIAPTFIGKSFSFYGKHTLIMLCAHLVELKTLPFHTIAENISDNRIIIEILTFIMKMTFITVSIYFVQFICKIQAYRKTKNNKSLLE